MRLDADIEHLADATECRPGDVAMSVIPTHHPE
jgi:hypothetical protein